MKRYLTLVLGLCGILMTFGAQASGDKPHLADVEFERSPETVKEGARILVETCLGCHGLKYVKYRHLQGLGFTDKEMADLRGEHFMNASLTQSMDTEIIKSMFGLIPPDLSLMAKAREGGPRYIYSFLTGFYQDADGNTNNHVFPNVRMPDILGISAADPEQRKQIEATAKKIATFLEWASDPHAQERKSLGVYVIIYLIFLSTLFYLLKKRIWKDVGVRKAQEQGAEVA